MAIAAPARTPSATTRTRPALGTICAVAVLLGLHVLLVVRYLPPAILKTSDPISNGDWPIKFTEAETVAEAGSFPARTWVYSPKHLAGYPAGVQLGVGTQAYDLFLLATRAWLEPVRAFKVFLYFLFILPPLVLVCAGKLAGLSGRALVAMLAVVMLNWHLESHIHYMWTFGTTAFLTGSIFAVVAGTLYTRMADTLASGGLVRLLLQSAGAGLIAGLALTLHPLTAFVLVSLFITPFLAGIVRPGRWLFLFLQLPLALAVVGINAHWLIPFFQLRECFIGGVPGPLATSWKHAFSDLFTDRSYQRPFDTTVILQLTLLTAAFGLIGARWPLRPLYRWQFAIALLLLGLISYGGSYLSFMRELQPYRFLGALLFAAVVPATVGLVELTNGSRVRIVGLAALLAILVMPRLTSPAIEALTIPAMRTLEPGEREFVEWAKESTGTESRILFSPGEVSLADRLNHYLARETIGGPYGDAPSAHRYANFQGVLGPWFGESLAGMSSAELSERMRLLNVGWVVVNETDPEYPLLAQHTSVLRSVQRFGPLAVFQNVSLEPSYFWEGTGQATAGPNHIDLTNVSKGRVVLKYHYLSTLRCEPELPLEAEHLLGDPLGFIAFHNPGYSEIRIYNSYQK